MFGHVDFWSWFLLYGHVNFCFNGNFYHVIFCTCFSLLVMNAMFILSLSIFVGSISMQNPYEYYFRYNLNLDTT